MKTLDMPSFGADMESGKVVEWCVQPGQKIKKGETVALIETSKGLIDMEVFEDCEVEQFIAKLDSEIPVGNPIVKLVGDKNSGQSQELEVEISQTEPEVENFNASHKTDEVLTNESQFEHSIKATPAAKAYAQMHNIDLKDCSATGVDGAVCLDDVSHSSKAVPRKRGEFDTDQMRHAIAAVVSKSKREIPHYYLSLDIDLTKSEIWLTKLNEERTPEDRVMVNVPLMCAVARALHKHPDFNGEYVNEHFSHSPDVNLGIAIRLRKKGLVAPAIHKADTLNVFEMMNSLKSIVERSKKGGLKQSELQNATTTLSSIGDRGTDQIYGVIFPPQVAIIGVGKVNQKPVAINGRVEIRSIVNVTLAADHRVTDGQMGARFLNEIRKLLQKPEQFLGGLS